MKKFIVVLILWSGIGYCNYHYTLGQFTAEFPYMNHRGVSNFMALTGPVGIPAVYLDTPLIWQDKPYTCQQRYEIYKGEFRSLDINDFQNDEYDCRGQVKD